MDGLVSGEGKVVEVGCGQNDGDEGKGDDDEFCLHGVEDFVG